MVTQDSVLVRPIRLADRTLTRHAAPRRRSTGVATKDRAARKEQLWHRLDNESGRAYEAFKVYMCLPPAERSRLGRGARGAAILRRSASPHSK